MKKIYIKGYINLDEDGYTFVYEDNKLTLISVDNKPSIFIKYKYIEYFKGFTLDGFDIIFYINNSIYYKDGSYICSPRCVILAQNKDYRLDEMEFDSISIAGGMLNRFYSNRKMIEFNMDKYFNDNEKIFNFKTVEETISEEKVILNNAETSFKLYIKSPGWKDDGSITFDNYDSLLSVKYIDSRSYIDVINDIASIEKLLKFCANRNSISVDNIFIEKNLEGKRTKIAEIFVPYMINNEANKDILSYEIIEGHLNELIECLDKLDYMFSIIPNYNKDFERISNKDYCSVISCFESIYKYVYGKCVNNQEIEEETKLEQVKKEVLCILKKINDKYKGKDRVKRDFIERFIHIIGTANLKLEKCINKEINENEYIIGCINYRIRDRINEKGIVESIIHAIKQRDNITHNNVIKLDDISIGIYEIIYKLNYIMVLNYIGIEKDKIKSTIEYLSTRKII